MVGQNIGKYRVLDRIGRGGMGTVYRAMDETLHREVAIKVLNAELNDPAVARRFRAEAVTVARLNHPGIATVYELFQHEGQWLMVMEFVRGETLEGLVTRQGPLPVEQFVEISMQTLAALAHAHSLGVVHRDLKPANIMMAETGSVKVMDFGIARVAGTEHLTSAGFMMGTPAYMAPEQVLGEDIDARADLFSIGVVLYYLATAKLPFKGGTPFEAAQSRLQDLPTPVHSIRPDLPQWMAQIFDIALARQPERRFQSAPIFRAALRRGLANLPLETPSPAAVPPELVTTAPPGTIPVVAPTGSSPTVSAPSTLDGPAPAVAAIPVPTQPAVDTLTGTSAPVPHDPGAMTVMSPAVEKPGAAAAVTVMSPKGMPDAAATMASPTAPVVAVPLPKSPASAPAASKAPAPGKSAGAGMPIAIAAAVLIAVGLGGWMLMRSRGAAPTETAPTTTADGAAAGAASSAPPAAEAATPAPVTDSAAAPADTAGSPLPPLTDRPLPADPAPGTPAASAPSAAAAPTSRAAGPASSRGTASATAPASAPAARGRAATPTPAVDDSPVAFRDVRLLTLTGKKAGETVALLGFGNGEVSGLAPSGATIVALPYGEITNAIYTRAKDPKWSVVLASPPADVDLPGGLFRSARRWLTLQSRSNFIIVRLNDNDWRQVIDMLATRAGVKVDVPAGSQ